MVHGHDQYAYLYGRRWRGLRDAYLRAHPLCRFCLDLGYVEAASIVDHIKPHRGDRALFFDQSNWQSLCKPCHDVVKQRLERTGRRAGTRLDGTPVDPMHPWNRHARAETAGGTGAAAGDRGRVPTAGERTAPLGANFHSSKTPKADRGTP